MKGRKKKRAPRWIWGRHVVEEALSARKAKIIEVLLLRESQRESAELMRTVQRAGARVRWVRKNELEKIAGGGSHQGIAARVIEKAAGSLDAFLESLADPRAAGTVIVALDQIQDPQNFGAIARSAACLGAAALIYPERRSAAVGQGALQASAGAVQKIPLFQVGNLAQTLLKLKERGFWVYGGDMSGKPVWEVKLNAPSVLVIGSEEKGIRSLVRSYCDEVVAIPQSKGGVSSLNASCAASILLYETARQKRL